MPKTGPTHSKTKTILAFKISEKSGFIDNFPNLLSKFPNFSNFIVHRNKTTESFQTFLFERGDKSIKSKELLNNIVKTEDVGKSVPPCLK